MEGLEMFLCCSRSVRMRARFSRADSTITVEDGVVIALGDGRAITLGDGRSIAL